MNVFIIRIIYNTQIWIKTITRINWMHFKGISVYLAYPKNIHIQKREKKSISVLSPFSMALLLCIASVSFPIKILTTAQSNVVHFVVDFFYFFFFCWLCAFFLFFFKLRYTFSFTMWCAYVWSQIVRFYPSTIVSLFHSFDVITNMNVTEFDQQQQKRMERERDKKQKYKATKRHEHTPECNHQEANTAW